MEKHVCPTCGKFTLKQITAKQGKNVGKKYWVCQAPTEVCRAIFNDADGKPEFPEDCPEALQALEWLLQEENQQGLSEWEKDFLNSLREKAEGTVDAPLSFTGKQLEMLRKLCDKFADAPSF